MIDGNENWSIKNLDQSGIDKNSFKIFLLSATFLEKLIFEDHLMNHYKLKVNQRFNIWQNGHAN